MTTVTFKGTPIRISGSLPQVGDPAPEFSLVNSDLSSISLSNFPGKSIVLNIFPSVDTSVCALQLKTFSKKVSEIDNVVLLSASLDLPFALGRFCGSEGVDNAITGSDFQKKSLAQNYGVEIQEGPLSGLYARAVLVLNKEHKIVYAELVPEVTDEPNYEEALYELKNIQ